MRRLPLDRPRPYDSIIAEAARLIDGARFPVVDVLTDPGGHPPISLYDGTLDWPENGRVIQEPVRSRTSTVCVLVE